MHGMTLPSRRIGIAARGMRSVTTMPAGRMRNAHAQRALAPEASPEVDLIKLVAGTDRGMAVFDESSRLAIEAAAEAACVSPAPVQEDVGGTWRLIYSSNFRRAAGGFGAAVGQVYQVIDMAAATVDNVVEFELPSPPFLSTSRPILRATLAHDLTVGSRGAGTGGGIDNATPFTLNFTGTRVSVLGGPGKSPWTAPELPNPFGPLPEPIKALVEEGAGNSATFFNLRVGSELRISRGAKDELRVYLRTGPLPSSREKA